MPHLSRPAPAFNKTKIYLHFIKHRTKLHLHIIYDDSRRTALDGPAGGRGPGVCEAIRATFRLAKGTGGRLRRFLSHLAAAAGPADRENQNIGQPKDRGPL